MNTGLLLEVLVAGTILIPMVTLFTLQYTSLTTLLLNERESRRILTALTLSDMYISGDISVERMGIRTNNLVDCGRLRPEANLYLRCGGIAFGEREGKLVVRRKVVWKGAATYFEVGIP